MKTKTLLIAAVMFLGLTAGAFAQATYQVGSIPVTAVIETGLTERTGDITFSQVSGQSLQGTVSITYGGTGGGVPITVDETKILILAPPGAPGYSSGNAAPATFPAGTTISTVTVNSLDNEAGVLVLNVPAGVAAGSFTVTGVRVAVAGSQLTELRANISSTNNAILAGQTSVVVITAIRPGIDDVSVSSSDRVNLNATTGEPVSGDNVSTIRVDEGFLNAFNDINPATNFGVGIRFTLTGIPEGIEITFPATATTDGDSPLGVPTFVLVDDDGITPIGAQTLDADSDSLSVFYRLSTTSDPTTLERLSVPVTVAFNDDEDFLPLAAGPIQFTTTLWPTGTAFDDGDVITLNRLIPRYVEQLIGPDTLANISSATATLLVPFAQRIEEAGYDTGFAVANTTADPEDLSDSVAAAVPQSGTITFHFFAQLPSPSGTMPDVETYTTQAGSPGTGLDAAGRLPAGSTYTVLLSELLEAADLPADFAGHVYIVTNFTDAHCLFVVSNFTTFSQGALALVLRDPRAEGLDQ
jgi:hypothetical protein